MPASTLEQRSSITSFVRMTLAGDTVFIPAGWSEPDSGLCDAYKAATPFPHIVIDDFLPAEVIAKTLESFPASRQEVSFDREVEKFKVSYNPDSLDSGFVRSLFYSFNSRPFLQMLERITGISGLLPDPMFVGGGFHRTSKGGHLGIHADFNLHRKLRLRRRVNVLIYLNPDWREEYGGNLELWEQDMSAKAKAIMPVLNRCVIFNTDDTSFHGHPEPLTTPDHITRRSIALYYYTASEAIFGEFTERTTLFKRRPGSGDKLGMKVKAMYLLNDVLPPFVMRQLLKLARRNRAKESATRVEA